VKVSRVGKYLRFHPMIYVTFVSRLLKFVALTKIRKQNRISMYNTYSKNMA